MQGADRDAVFDTLTANVDAVIAAERILGGDARHVQDQLVLSEECIEPDDDAGICGCVNGLILDLCAEYGEFLRRVDFARDPREKVGGDLGRSRENLHAGLHRACRAVRELLDPGGQRESPVLAKVHDGRFIPAAPVV